MHHPTTVSSPGGIIEASVLIGGRAQPLYRRSDGRMFVPGAPGSSYTIRVRNKTGTRAEVIATVDGRHVLKDEPGDLHVCRGLVIPAHGVYEFRGWRVTDEESREFLFGSPESSVAAQSTGNAENAGVIGFAAWRERDFYGAYDFGGSGGSYGGCAGLDGSYSGGAVTRSETPVATASAGGGVASYASNAVGGTLGTGIGARQDDHVGRTDFTRTGSPDILVIGYDTEAELIRRGILGPADPDPFPGARTGYEKYVTAP